MATATDTDLRKIAAKVEIAESDELPAPIRRQPKDNPFVEVVQAAAKDHKRRVLAGRYSLVPYEGKKGACEAFTVMSALNRAAKQADVKVTMRRFDVQGDTCRLTFKVS